MNVTLELPVENFWDSVVFDGSNYLKKDDPVGLDLTGRDFTLIAWMRSTDITSESGLVCSRTGNVYGNGGFSLSVNIYSHPGKLVGWLSEGVLATDKILYSTALVCDGAWHLVMLSANREGNAQLYVDGVPSGSPVDISALGEIPTTILKIASDQGVGTGFQGSIGETQIVVGYAFSDADALAAWRSGIFATPPGGTIAAHYKWQGDYNDETGNNNLTPIGSPPAFESRTPTSIDITKYLDDESDMEIGQELEAKMFQRTVDDVQLHCSNLWEEFCQWLSTPGARNRVVIREDGRVLFRGEIESPVNFDAREEWVSLDCFSLTKRFWDICKQTRISKATPIGKEDDLWTTVEEVIKREVTFDRFDNLFVGYQINALYATRRIRFWGYTVDESIGNNGRYKDLDPRLTLDELLKAMTVYYNADIFIDPETQVLVMQPRDEVLNDLNHQLDDIIEEDDEETIQLYDEKIDYLGLSLNFAKPTKPTVNYQEPVGTGLDPGRYVWAVTYLYRSGSFNSESALGDESDPLKLYKTGLPVSSAQRWKVSLSIPLGPSGCIGRRIYRTKNVGVGTLYLVGQIDDNSTIEFFDLMGDGDLHVSAPDTAITGMIWLRFNEETGSWDDVLIGDEAGLNAPFGEFHDVTPHLRFLAKTFGYGFEINKIYMAEARVVIETKQENGFEVGTRVKVNHTNCTPPLEGEYTISQVGIDKVSFVILAPPVTSPGIGGTVIRSSDESKGLKPEILDVASETLIDTFAFFGNEKDQLDKIQEQWKKLFLSRKRVRMTVKGLNFRVGDSASLNRRINGLTVGKCVVKRAKNNLTKERTTLELLTL